MYEEIFSSTLGYVHLCTNKLASAFGENNEKAHIHDEFCICLDNNQTIKCIYIYLITVFKKNNL